MDITSNTKLRRRPLTYGKASRKAIFDYPPLVSNALLKDDSDSTAESEGFRVGGKGSETVAHTLGSQHTCYASPSSSPSSVNLDSMPTASPNSKFKLGKSSGDPKLYKSAKDDFLFEVPSSSDEMRDQPQILQQGSRKKRKTAGTSGHEEGDIVWDNKNLQLHIAAQDSTEAALSAVRRKTTSVEKTFCDPSRAFSDQESHERIPNTLRPNSRTTLNKARKSGAGKNANQVVPKGKLMTQGSSHITYSMAPTEHPNTIPKDHKPGKFAQILPDNSGSRNSKQKTKNIRVQEPKPQVQSTGNFSDPGKLQEAVSQEQKSAARSHTPDRLERAKSYLESCFSPSRLDLQRLEISGISDHSSQAILTRAVPSPPVKEAKRTTFPRGKLKDKLHAFERQSLWGMESDSGSSTSAESSLDESLSHKPSATSKDLHGEFGERAVKNYSNTLKVPTDVGAMQSISSHLSGGPKVTYARQRSYLTEDDAIKGTLLSVPSENLNIPLAKNRSGLQFGPRSHVLQGLHEEPEEENSTIRSIHELREAGGNARLMGEVEAILDDIDTKNIVSVSLKRSGLLDLTAKLQDPSVCRQFADHGFEGRLLAHVDSTSDQTANLLLISSILQIAAFSSSLHFLVQVNEHKVISYLSNQLNAREDLTLIVTNRKSNTSKAFRAEIATLRDTVLRSSVWKHRQPSVLTAGVLALQCIEYLVFNMRGAGYTVEVLTENDIEQLMSALLPVSPESMSSSNQVAQVQLALSILENSTLASSIASITPETPWTINTLESIIHFLIEVQTWSGEGMEEIKALTLRLCLNLSNHGSGFCKALSTVEVVHASMNIASTNFRELSADRSEEDLDLVLGTLVISLLLMTNLAENGEDARKLFMQAANDSSTPIDTLLDLFLSRCRESSEILHEQDIKANVPLGYLAVLLSYLCISAVANALIRTRLPNNSLALLLDQVEEFLQFHREIEKFHVEENKVDMKASFVDRVQPVVNRLKAEDRKF